MTKNNVEKLRQQAQALLTNDKIDRNGKEFKDNIEQLLEELSIHQIELELQNEELRDTQLELTTEKNKYADLFNHAPLPYFLFDIRGNILEINKAGIELLQTAQQFLINRPFITFLGKEKIREFHEYIKKVFDFGEPLTQNFVLQLRNKEERFVQLNSNLIYNAREGKYYCRTIGIDRTEKLKAEEQLKASEQKYRELSDNIEEGIYQTENGYLKSINKPFARIFRYKAENLIDIPVWKLAAPESQEQVKTAFIQKVEKKDSSPEEIQCIRGDGTVFWAEIKLSIFDKNNRIFGTVADITARKKAELKLKESEELHRLILSNISDAVFLTNNNLQFTYVCPNVHFLFGISEHEVWQKMTIGQLIPNLDAALEEFKKNGEAKNLERRILHADGANRIALLNIKRINISKGNLLFTMHDITERKEAQNQLQKQAEELREINATKDKFFSIVAHDLKNPFNTLLGYSQLLVDEAKAFDENKKRQFARSIYKSASRTYNLLENLLVWSRSQTNRIPFNPEYVNLKNILLENKTFADHTAQKKSIQIHTDIPEEAHVHADKAMLNTILRNLISNAIKFTQEGGKVTVGYRQTEPEKVEIFVRDTGVGMNQTQKEHLFRIDESSSTEGTSRERGTGLGLILSKEFIGHHGGEIQVDSQPGKGSTFRFILQSKPREENFCKKYVEILHNIKAYIKENPELKNAFVNEVIPEFHVTYKTLSSNRVAGFIKILNQVSHDFNLHELNQFSEAIQDGMAKFDINQLNSCFAEFENLLEEVERLHI